MLSMTPPRKRCCATNLKEILFPKPQSLHRWAGHDQTLAFARKNCASARTPKDRVPAKMTSVQKKSNFLLLIGNQALRDSNIRAGRLRSIKKCWQLERSLPRRQ